MTALKTSFVVTTRNEPPASLDATIRGLFETTSHQDCEILVVDDGSDLPVARSSREVMVVRNERAIGISRSRRLGASLAGGEILVWLDAHMSFAADWLDRMIEHADSGTVLCSAFWNYDLSRCHSWGADFAWNGKRDQGSQRYPGFAVRHRTHKPGPGGVDVPMLIGGCYMMRRGTYQQLGGFSPLSRVRGGNEQELSARAWMSGLKIRCVTDAKVGHQWRPHFPYPVEFAHLEFNQLALVRSIFEEATVGSLEKCFQPYSPQLRRLVEEETGFADWRRTVQLARTVTDAEFFSRFVPGILSYVVEPTRSLNPVISIHKKSPKERKISFVVTARNEPSLLLEATVDGLLETSAHRHREIIVVDDGSLTPVTIERPHTHVVRNERALGVAQSRRGGAAIASGDVLVWLDAHMRFAPDWLDQMMMHADSGALLCAAWWDYELSRPLCWGAEFVWCGERDHKAGRAPGLTFRHRTKFPGDGAVEVPMAIGACYMALRESYDHCGGFSPFFRIWGKSEQDLSMRMWISGLGVKCVTGARVGHFSRPQFPYPVTWSDIEFNQAIVFRTILEGPSLRAAEAALHPLPEDVQAWLAQVDFQEWRDFIQDHRRMSDSEFFRRFVPDAPAGFRSEPACDGGAVEM